jgi:hypothetical protein
MQALFKTMMMFSTKSIAQGAATSVYCSLAPTTELQVQEEGDITNLANHLYVDCQPKTLTTKVAQDQHKAEALWTKAEQLCQRAQK